MNWKTLTKKIRSDNLLILSLFIFGFILGCLFIIQDAAYSIQPKPFNLIKSITFGTIGGIMLAIAGFIGLRFEKQRLIALHKTLEKNKNKD
ncbi:hypothetical protein K8R43_03720 [archaeon]|nr:hypothetical protein [archaeon]